MKGLSDLYEAESTAIDNRKIDIDLSKVRVAHRRFGPGRITIAWTEEDGIVRYAVSLCSPVDQFGEARRPGPCDGSTALDPTVPRVRYGRPAGDDGGEGEGCDQ